MLTSNQASSLGGGAHGSTLNNCVLTGNSAPSGGGAWAGTLNNCILTTNSARGGISLDDDGVPYRVGGFGGAAHGCTLNNCTLTANWAIVVAYDAGDWFDGDGGGAAGGTLNNCIVYFNSNGGNYTADSSLRHCCTTPLPTSGVGNITNAPLFVDYDGGDFRLRPDSPCIDAGTNLVGLLTTDILGNTRFIDGNGDGIVAWDIGAYEYNSYPPPRFTCAPQRMPDCWRLSMTGAPNKWVQIQRSTDLKNWEALWSGWIGPEGVKQVDDGDTSQTMMFYRAVVE